MTDTQRTTIYLERTLHRALRLKAAEAGSNVSSLINEAVRTALAEDLDDIEALDARALEPAVRFEDLLREMVDDGAL